jgi:muramoyltetrapeptide carboxypeptidase
MAKIKAHPLPPGGTIGVTAPASPVGSEAALEMALSPLREAGFRVKLGKTARPEGGGTVRSDLERLEDLERIWLDPEVDAVWCLRGGYGSLRLLPKLYYAMLAKHPKLLIGFSDITALELGLWSQAKLVSFHGPVLNALAESDFSREQALAMLTGALEPGPLLWPAQDRLYLPIRPGTARGTLLGGNLATLASLVGTRFWPALDGAVLFLEEAGEAAYRVDRWLTQLLISGLLDEAAAVLIGRSVPVPEERETELIAVYSERLAALSCPSAYGFPIGHLREQWTVPQGITVGVDIAAGEICILERPFSGNTV